MIFRGDDREPRVRQHVVHPERRDAGAYGPHQHSFRRRPSDHEARRQDLGVHPGESKRRNVHEPHQRRPGLQIVNLGQRDARGGDAGG